jgi:hypothetical protein
MLSNVFTFAPVPLTTDVNPLAVAADLARRRQTEKALGSARPRHRIQPARVKAPVADPVRLAAA